LAKTYGHLVYIYKHRILIFFRQTELSIDDLETELERKERWRSIYTIYFTMFLMSLGFSIILTGVWPYLGKVDMTKIYIDNKIIKNYIYT